MGLYINPPEGTKEEWLLEHGQETETPTWPAPAGQLPICLVENPAFTAAAICCDERDFEEVGAPDATPEEIAAVKADAEEAGLAFYSLVTGTQRPRTWYYVPIDKIIEVEPRVQSRLDGF